MRQNLKNTRRGSHLTQKRTAELLGISERHYRLIEAGKSKGSIEVWEALKDLLNESIDDLLLQIDDTIVPDHEKEDKS